MCVQTHKKTLGSVRQFLEKPWDYLSCEKFVWLLRPDNHFFFFSLWITTYKPTMVTYEALMVKYIGFDLALFADTTCRSYGL